VRVDDADEIDKAIPIKKSSAKITKHRRMSDPKEFQNSENSSRVRQKRPTEKPPANTTIKLLDDAAVRDGLADHERRQRRSRNVYKPVTLRVC